MLDGFMFSVQFFGVSSLVQQEQNQHIVKDFDMYINSTVSLSQYINHKVHIAVQRVLLLYTWQYTECHVITHTNLTNGMSLAYISISNSHLLGSWYALLPKTGKNEKLWMSIITWQTEHVEDAFLPLYMATNSKRSLSLRL